MSRLQSILLVVVIAELAAFAFLSRSRPAQLPAVDWSSALIEEPVAQEIQKIERTLDPSQPGSWVELAAAYRTFGLFPQAEYCYRQADQLSPADRSYLFYWAECFDLMGETKEATARYRRIIQDGVAAPLGAKTAQYCWLNIGQNRLREEKVSEAMDALRKAGDLPKARFLLARVLTRSGQADEASALLDQLLRESPGTIEYNQMKSWAEAELGHDSSRDFYERSLRAGQPLLKTDPTYQDVLKRRNAMGSEAWYQASLALEAEGKLSEALAQVSRALQAFWAEDRAQQLAKLQLLGARPREAMTTAEECLRRVGASAKTLDIIGVAAVQLGDKAKAQQVWEEATQLEPTPNLYWKLAELQKLSGNTGQMLKYQALEQYQMGKESWRSNDLSKALGHFEAGVALDGTFAPLWFYLAETRRFLGDAAGAETAYRRCLQMNPDYGRAIRGLDRLGKGRK